MSSCTAVFSPKLAAIHYSHGKASSSSSHLSRKTYPVVGPTKKHHHHLTASASADNGSGVAAAAPPPPLADTTTTVISNGSPPSLEISSGFQDARWVDGTWDIKQFAKDGNSTDWDAVIDAGNMLTHSSISIIFY